MTLFAAVLLAMATGSRADDRQELRSAWSPRVRSAEVLGAAAPGESIPMSVTLQLQHRDELDALIAAQQQPGAPQYHQWLSPEQFTERFAPSPAAYNAIVDWLRRQGFSVRTWPHRLRIDFSGRVGQAENAFQVRMNHYRRRERDAVANDRPPTLPARFAGAVQELRLHTFRFAEPVLSGAAAASTNTMAPKDIYTAYNVQPVLDRGIDGTGQTIAIVARSDFNVGDVTSFQQQFGVRVRQPTKVFFATNPGVGSPNGACAGYRSAQRFAQCVYDEEAEVLLDTEWASALAPGAAVLVDVSDTDIDASLTDVVTHHPEAKIISVSFGICERLEPTAVGAWEALAAQAAAQGQTLLVAAGDSGADECQDGAGASVNALSSPPEITAVGGTALDPGFDASGAATGHVSEIVWNDSSGASGGGVSTMVPKPSYQAGLDGAPGAFRQQPDVALMASPTAAGYVMTVGGQLAIIGGTSPATPSWAGIVAMINQASAPSGVGAFNGTLYRLGRSQAAGGPAVFYDITSGDNTFDGVPGYAAGAGFDRASGWGTPNVVLLVDALTPQACPGDCNGDGAVTVDELVTAVNVALGRAPVSACQSLDTNGDGTVSIAEIVQATVRALDGC